jgi:hypothetical protein
MNWDYIYTRNYYKNLYSKTETERKKIKTAYEKINANDIKKINANENFPETLFNKCTQKIFPMK